MNELIIHNHNYRKMLKIQMRKVLSRIYVKIRHVNLPGWIWGNVHVFPVRNPDWNWTRVRFPKAKHAPVTDSGKKGMHLCISVSVRGRNSENTGPSEHVVGRFWLISLLIYWQCSIRHMEVFIKRGSVYANKIDGIVWKCVRRF